MKFEIGGDARRVIDLADDAVSAVLRNQFFLNYS